MQTPEKTAHTMTAEMGSPPAIGHMMAHDDPDNPQNFPMHRKIYVSAASFAFGFVVYEIRSLTNQHCCANQFSVLLVLRSLPQPFQR